MKNFLIGTSLALVIGSFIAFGQQTLPPGIVGIKGSVGTGNTPIGSVGDSLKVDVTNSLPQPSPPANQNVTVINPSPIPVNGSVSVSNFPAASPYPTPPAIQPVSQSGSWTNACTQSGSWTDTVLQGTSPWTEMVTNFPSVYPITAASPIPVNVQNTPTVLVGNPSPIPVFVSNATNSTVNQGAPGPSPWPVDFLSPQAVTGTFFQATQPVSIATMPTTPVTGTFWQTTQPVSGTFFQATQPVSGTFFQATQPVSIATMPNTPVTQSTSPWVNKIVDGSGNTWGPATLLSGTEYFPVVLASSGTSGSAVPVRTLQVGGTDGTNLHTLNTDTNGLVNANVRPDSTLNTYSACYTNLAVPASPTDLFYITGSATKTVTVLSDQISGTETTVLMHLFQRIIRTTADSGGSCAGASIGLHDQNNAAATASVQGCTTSPTGLGTSAGIVQADAFVIPATTGVDSSWPQIRNYAQPGQGQGIVLRGTSQGFYVNVSATFTTGTLNWCVTWTEQ